jgi:phospholipid/cholesterol/gamma-HCH transport system ATP-binding protein
MKPIIEVQNVTMEFKGRTVLKNINLIIYEHESIIFIGPSGAGKTVLLKLLAGIYKPTSGDVLVEGENWQKLTSKEKHKLAKKVGMMFQQSALFDTMTTLQNVEFPMREHFDYSEEELKKRALEFLDKVNLKESADKLPGELSGGMQRRLGIARAIALHPHIIFYDDPTAGQDPIQSDQVLTLISKSKIENDATLIMTTSQLKTARRMGERIIMVVDGEIIEAGNPSELEKHSDPRIQQFIHAEIHGPIKIG